MPKTTAAAPSAALLARTRTLTLRAAMDWLMAHYALDGNDAWAGSGRCVPRVLRYRCSAAVA